MRALGNLLAMETTVRPSVVLEPSRIHSFGCRLVGSAVVMADRVEPAPRVALVHGQVAETAGPLEGGKCARPAVRIRVAHPRRICWRVDHLHSEVLASLLLGGGTRAAHRLSAFGAAGERMVAGLAHKRCEAPAGRLVDQELVETPRASRVRRHETIERHAAGVRSPTPVADS